MPLQGFGCNWIFSELGNRLSHWSSPTPDFKPKELLTMTPTPPSSSDESSLPPRHRPNLGDLVKDATELDLWAFDSVEHSETLSTNTSPSSPTVPAPRNLIPSKVSDIKTPKALPDAKGAASNDKVGASSSKIRPKAAAGVAPQNQLRANGDFDDLDHWDDLDPSPENEKTPEQIPNEPEKPPTPQEPDEGESLAIPSELTAEVDKSKELLPDVLKNIVPPTLQKYLVLTKLERIGLISLLAVLLIGFASIVIFSLNRLPTESARVKANDFPIQGKYLKIVSAENYWRTPIVDGKTADIIRRGTVLIPVIHLFTSDGSAAIRVIFRNADGESIGDIVTRAVQNGQELEIAATAGFDDIGMHAAYRTGKGKPWRIEVYESKSADSLTTDFKKLFEMNITTARR